MSFALETFLLAFALCVGMLVLTELGVRLGRRRLASDPEGARAGTAATEGAVFALLGLLIAFTFSSAWMRFDARRELIVQEINAIGTAWLRLDLLPEPARAELQQGFRDYVDARISIYADVEDQTAVRAGETRASELQRAVWTRAESTCRTAGQPAVTMLVLPALNQMFDVASARIAASRNHAPPLVYWLLIALALTCALLAGFAMAPSQRPLLTHRIAFACVVSMTVYAIHDLEYPRQGLIRIDHFDHLLVELRESMN